MNPRNGDKRSSLRATAAPDPDHLVDIDLSAGRNVQVSGNSAGVRGVGEQASSSAALAMSSDDAPLGSASGDLLGYDAQILHAFLSPHLGFCGV